MAGEELPTTPRAEGVPAAADYQADVGGEHGDLGVVDAAIDDHEGDVGGDGSGLAYCSIKGLTGLVRC